MTLSAVQWTPVFDFDTPGDLAVNYTTQQGDYFKDPTTGITILRYTVQFTPTFTSAGGAAYLNGHGLSKAPGFVGTSLGKALGSSNLSDGLGVSFQPSGKLRHGNVQGAFLGTTSFVSGQTYTLQGEIVLVTQ